MEAVIKKKINNVKYEFKVVNKYYGIEFSLYADSELVVMFALYEEADKIPETEDELRNYAEGLIRDLKELVPFLHKYNK